MRIRNTFSAAIALIAVFALMMPVGAKTDRVEFTAEEYTVDTIPAVRDWNTPEESTLNHVRGLTNVYDVVSNEPLWDGTATVVINWNLDLATFEGTMWGTSRIELDDYDGGFVGTWVAKFTGDERVWVGHGVAQGYGEVEGYKAFFDLDWAPYGSNDAGYILTPGNK